MDLACRSRIPGPLDRPSRIPIPRQCHRHIRRQAHTRREPDCRFHWGPLPCPVAQPSAPTELSTATTRTYPWTEPDHDRARCRETTVRVRRNRVRSRVSGVLADPESAEVIAASRRVEKFRASRVPPYVAALEKSETAGCVAKPIDPRRVAGGRRSNEAGIVARAAVGPRASVGPVVVVPPAGDGQHAP